MKNLMLKWEREREKKENKWRNELVEVVFWVDDVTHNM